jgi:hypothetical protein
LCGQEFLLEKKADSNDRLRDPGAENEKSGSEAAAAQIQLFPKK